MAASRLSTRTLCKVLSRRFLINEVYTGAPKVRCLALHRCLSTSSHRLQTEHGDGGASQQQQQNQNSSSTGFSEEEQPSQKQQDEETDYENSIRYKILAAALPHVHEHGWTIKALEAGAQTEGLPPIAHGMFPNGGADLALYFYAKCNENLVDILKAKVEEAKAEGLEKPKVKPLIRDALEARLRMTIPYLDKWPQAMAIMSLPQNAPKALKNLKTLVDDIWYYAGDRSVDFNWYTKRVTLAGVYKTTEVYMIQDKSLDFQDTWEFLDNRLEDLRKFGSAKKSCEQSGDVLKEGLNGLIIMGRNVLGLNSRNR